jgi:hypothetical protein
MSGARHSASTSVVGRGLGVSDWQLPRTCFFHSHPSDQSLIATMVIPLLAFSLCRGGLCLYARWSVRAFKFICIYSEINCGAH